MDATLQRATCTGAGCLPFELPCAAFSGRQLGLGNSGIGRCESFDNTIAAPFRNRAVETNAGGSTAANQRIAAGSGAAAGQGVGWHGFRVSWVRAWRLSESRPGSKY